MHSFKATVKGEHLVIVAESFQAAENLIWAVKSNRPDALVLSRENVRYQSGRLPAASVGIDFNYYAK